MAGLDNFLNPGSVVLIGATDRESAAGTGVLENLMQDGNKRKIFPVNPNRDKVFDLKCYPDLKSLPEPPDLAVVVTPAETVAGILEDCGQIGVKAVIIIPAGFKERGPEGLARENKVSEIAKKYGIRIIGPNCMGVIRPSTGLNTTFFMGMPKPGNIAFFSQSGALGAGILDWAIRKNIGFSAFISLGSMLDIDFGDLIDYFGEDPETRSIIIYPESIGNAKKFMSAARGFARSKPILVLKPGRFEESAKAVRSHTGALIGEDLHYDAIFRRAGAVRVEEMRDLFNCASFLNSSRLPRGPNLGIITNGGGPAVLAIDHLISRGGKLAELNPSTLEALNKVLPDNWSMGNPIDIREDATAQHYVDALRLTCKAHEVNGVTVIYTPQGRAPLQVAKEIMKGTKDCTKPILTVWIGANEIAEARQLFYDNNYPVFEFPEEAIKTYVYMYQYAQNLEMLYETPEESPMEGASLHHLKTLIRRANRTGRQLLSAEDVNRFLSTYRIDTPRPIPVKSADEAIAAAEKMGYPLVMKIDSPDIIHKMDAGGVITDIRSAAEIKKAYDLIMKNVEEKAPEARIDAVNLFNMVSGYEYELIVGSKKDDACGPVIAFGLGGRETEFFKDIAVGIPPLNQALARRVIEQTKIYEILVKGSRTRPPVNLKILDEILVKVSELIVDFPEIKELDINPLIIKDERSIALDAKIILDSECACDTEYGHLIITPYPNRYIQPWRCKDGRSVLLRPIKPEDEGMERKAYEALSEETLRLRFFSPSRKATHEMLTRFCNIDYDREMVIIGEYTNGEKRSVGNARLIIQADGENAEFGVLVAEDFRNVGLGLKLSDVLIGIAREKSVKTIYGIVLKENIPMINLARRLGFQVDKYSEDEVKLTLEL